MSESRHPSGPEGGQDGRHAYDFNLELFDKLNKEVSTECVKVMHIMAMRTYLSLSNMVPPGCASNTAFTQRDGNEGTNFQVSTFTGMDLPYSLPDNVALLTLQSPRVDFKCLYMQPPMDLVCRYQVEITVHK
ncbi:galactose mutarotase-like domain-containing protein [Artemisia annua]|uniref:Galactose mutarotase-like domain-containing protein n=1 Tax=Artemisia annua TaxID=35608 RepID=A0A2U1L342_ARTAN|nr:galactose mutarotase-like domain-containing protein [Artemisia annua]